MEYRGNVNHQMASDIPGQHLFEFMTVLELTISHYLHYYEMKWMVGVIRERGKCTRIG